MNALKTQQAKHYLQELCLYSIKSWNKALMPRSAPTPCRHPGCPELLATPGYCDRHLALVHRDYGRARRGFDSERNFYQSVRWRSVRAAFLREHPTCKACSSLGYIAPAVVADHVLPLKEGGDRFVGKTCSRFACRATTARPRAKLQPSATPPRGSESLRSESTEAWP